MRHPETKLAVLICGSLDIGRKITAAETLQNITQICAVFNEADIPVCVFQIPTLGLINSLDLTKSERITELDALNASIRQFVNEPNSINIQGPDLSSFEYKGAFLYNPVDGVDSGFFNRRGYLKLGKDVGELMLNPIVKIEFKLFKKMLDW